MMNKQTFYRLLASTLIVAGISACDARPDSEIGGRSLLDMFAKDGPEVSGVSDALLASAKQAEGNKDYGRALQFYKQLADASPKNASYQLGVAGNLRRLGKFDEAIQAYDALLHYHPRNVVALEGKGLALISKADFPEASTVLEQVMAMDNRRWRTLNGVGLLFVAKNMPNGAISYFDSALSVQPDHPTVLNNVGLTLALQKNYPRAIAALNRATSKVKSGSNQRKQIDLNLALVLGLSGDTVRAEKVASRHLSGSALQNNLGFYAELAGDDKLAKAYLNSAISGSSTFYKRAWENLEELK